MKDNDTRLQQLASELATKLAIAERTRPMAELAVVTGLPLGTVAGLVAQGARNLKEVGL